MYTFSDSLKAIKPGGGVRALAKYKSLPGMISFTSGVPASEFLPVDDLKTAYNAMMEENGRTALQYCDTAGWYHTREQICSRMKIRNQIDAKPGDVTLTVGSGHALYVCGRLFLNPGDVVLLEAPSYAGAIQAFQACQANFVVVPTNENGPIVEELDKILATTKNVKLMYAIPEFQNPSGHTWSLEVRKQFMEVINKYEVPVLEDNPYGELRFKGDFLPSLRSMDPKGLVIYLGSFSKILSPGLRLGWTCATPELAEKITLMVNTSVLQASTTTAMHISKYLDMFDLDEHLSKIIPIYKHRCELMLNTMKETFPDGIKFSEPEGGLFTWVEMPDYVDTKELSMKGVEKRVLFVPGFGFFPDGGNRHCLRLNYSSSTDDQIVEGIHRLAEVIKENI